jgi:heat shock protein HslJ
MTVAARTAPRQPARLAIRPLLVLALAVLPLTGCAFTIPIRPSLENSRWQVRAINGERLPPTSEFYVEFRTGRITGRLGCNRFGGLYWLGPETITVHPVEITEMACDPVAMAHEAAGLAALRTPLRIFWTDLGARLELTSATGSLDLRRTR